MKMVLCVILIAAAGFALRLINLGTEPYWQDELSSVAVARHFPSAGQLVDYIAEVEFHPPLHFLLLQSWISWFGDGEWAVRFLSVIFGTALVGVVYFLAMSLFQNRLAAVTSAALAALSPMLIEFSQEARPYIFAAFMAALGIFSLWKFDQDRRKLHLGVYILSGIAGLYLSYSYAFFLLAASSWWLLDAVFVSRGRHKFLWWLAAHTAIVLGFSFWLPSLLLKIFLGKFALFGLAQSADSARIPEFFESLVDNLVWVNKFPDSHVKYIIFLRLLGKIVWLFGLLFVIWKMGADRDKKHFRALLFLVWLTFIPLAIFFFSPQSVPYAPIYYRHVIFAALPLLLIAGFIVSRLPPKPAAGFFLILAATLAPSIVNVAGDDSAWDHSYQVKTAARYINEHYRPGDLVLVQADVRRVSLSYYLKPEINPVTFFPLDYYGLDIHASRGTTGLVELEYPTRLRSEDFSKIPRKLQNLLKLYEPERIWLYDFDYDSGHPIGAWLSGHGWRHAFKAVEPVFLLDLYVY